MKKQGSAKKKAILAICAIISLFLLISLITADSEPTGNVALIKISGAITTGQESGFASDSVSSERIISAIEKAEKNSNIKGILLEINSPGGAAVASQELSDAIYKTENPTITVIRDIGTSGAYWAAASSDRIIASPLSITGSVGATASFIQFAGLMEKYGIGYERLVSGEYKDTGAPFRNLTAEETQFLQEMIDATGEFFLNDVAEKRGLNSVQVEEIRTARIYTGSQALNIGLIDQLGNRQTAKEEMGKTIGEEAKLAEYEITRPFTLTDILFAQASTIGEGIAAGLAPHKQTISLT